MIFFNFSVPGARIKKKPPPQKKNTIPIGFPAKGVELSALLAQDYSEPEKVVDELVLYGRDLYAAGRPYSHVSETMNALGATKSTIRRMLTGASDVACA